VVTELASQEVCTGTVEDGSWVHKKMCQNLSYCVLKPIGKTEEFQSMIVKKTGLINEKWSH
jgi:hypothetical protein